MNRNQMIDLLIEDDLNWHNNDDRDDYFANIMRKGFIGYEHWNDQALIDEYIARFK
jgi:hypothetical protein